MRTVKLLKEYDGHGAGEVISVSNNIAFGLVDRGVAEETGNRDFLVKPEFGESKAIDLKKLTRGQRRNLRRKQKPE